MIEIKVTLDNIDYNGIAELVVPIVKDKFADSNNQFIKKIIDSIPSSGMNKMLKTVFSMLSQDQKDEIAVSFFEKYQDKIVETLKQTAHDKGVELNITELKVEKK